MQHGVSASGRRLRHEVRSRRNRDELGPCLEDRAGTKGSRSLDERQRRRRHDPSFAGMQSL